jgi:hypothetical protein
LGKQVVNGKLMRRRIHISTYNFELGTKIYSKSYKVNSAVIKMEQ